MVLTIYKAKDATILVQESYFLLVENDGTPWEPIYDFQMNRCIANYSTKTHKVWFSVSPDGKQRTVEKLHLPSIFEGAEHKMVVTCRWCELQIE